MGEEELRKSVVGPQNRAKKQAHYKGKKEDAIAPWVVLEKPAQAAAKESLIRERG